MAYETIEASPPAFILTILVAGVGIEPTFVEVMSLTVNQHTPHDIKNYYRIRTCTSTPQGRVLPLN
jgi:hypothetical protein